MADETIVGSRAAAKLVTLVKAYVDRNSHDYYDVNCTDIADATDDIDGGITSVRCNVDKTFAEISAAYSAGKIVRCLYNARILELAGVSDDAYWFNGYGTTWGVTRNGTYTIVIRAASLTAETLAYKSYAAGELPIPDSEGSQNGCALVVDKGKWMYSEGKLIPATPTSNGLMSAADKTKLDGVAEGANKTTVIEYLDPLNTSPVASSTLFTYISEKADRTLASEDAAGLMSSTDKKKLNGIEEGADKTNVDEALSDGSTNPVQNKAITEALNSIVRDTVFDITVVATSAEWTADNGIYYKPASANYTFNEIAAAYHANKTLQCTFAGMVYHLVDFGASQYIFASHRGAVENDPQYSGLGAYPTSQIVIGADGCTVSVSSGDLPAVTDADNGKMLIVSDGKWVLQDVAGTTVDTDLSSTSENPVQNKAVTAALSEKLNTRGGGTVRGHLTVTTGVTAGGYVAFGDKAFGFSEAADDAAQLRVGGADVDDNPPPLARLKVSAPAENDDATTKAYVDNAFSAPVLTSPVMIRKAGATTSSGVYLSTVDTGEKQAEIKLEDVNENSPVAIANLRTPTGTGTDSYAATKGYVDSKIAAGGVTVDTALSDTSVNPVQNKTIKAALDGKAGTAAATQSADGLLSAADKKKLDGIATGATKVTVDAVMSDTSENPVQNKAILSVLNKKAAASDLALKADKASPKFTGSIRLQEESGQDFHVTAAVRPFDDTNISLNFEPESPNSSYAGVVIDCLATVEADINGWPQVAVNQEMMERYVGKKVSGLQTQAQVQTAINSALTGVYTPKGSVAFASLPTAAAGNKGWVYNITDAFTTTAAFVEGAGHSYGAGTNVVCVDVGSGSYKWDVLAGTIDLTELTADEVQTLWDSV